MIEQKKRPVQSTALPSNSDREGWPFQIVITMCIRVRPYIRYRIAFTLLQILEFINVYSDCVFGAHWITLNNFYIIYNILSVCVSLDDDFLLLLCVCICVEWLWALVECPKVIAAYMGCINVHAHITMPYDQIWLIQWIFCRWSHFLFSFIYYNRTLFQNDMPCEFVFRFCFLHV